MNQKRDRDFIECDCMHSSDEEEEGVYEFSPPQDANNVPWIINTPRKWTEYVYLTNSIHKFANLMMDVEDFNLPVADRKGLFIVLLRMSFTLMELMHFLEKMGVTVKLTTENVSF